MAEPMTIVVHEAGPEEGGEVGKPAILVADNAYCGTCGGFHDFEICPECGADIIISFGLGGGPGFGLSKVCEKRCGWFWKRMLPWGED